MGKTLKTILAGLTATLMLSTTPIALNAYNLNKPELFVQTEKRDLYINFSEDGSKFAYAKVESTGRSASSEIIINEGGIEKALTDGKYFDIRPAFSPDGKKIAFFRDIVVGWGPVCIMDSDGKNLETLVPSTLTKVSWSPDGKEIAYRGTHTEKKDGKNEDYKAIILVDVETTAMKYLTTNEGCFDNPEFTADGRILYTFSKEDSSVENKSIWIMDRDGKNKQCLIPAVNDVEKVQNADGSITIHEKQGSTPQFSIDGNLMAYVLERRDVIFKATPVEKPFEKEITYEVKKIKEEYKSGIYVKNLKTGETRLVTDEGNLWFPEIKNNKVYFSRYDHHETEHDIYSIDLE